MNRQICSQSEAMSAQKWSRVNPENRLVSDQPMRAFGQIVIGGNNERLVGMKRQHP